MSTDELADELQVEPAVIQKSSIATSVPVTTFIDH
jgi:hypothetical protein